VNKALLFILIILFLNNCTSDKKEILLEGRKTNLKKNDDIKTIRAKLIIDEQEFNPTIKIQISEGKFGTNSDSNQNDIGELGYQGLLERVGKYNFKSFNDFEYIETKPIHYNGGIVFFDNNGTIILYDQNQNVIWKKNFYNKSEKKLNPRLNLAIKENILIVTDSVAKYYAVDLQTSEILWTKKNIVPFNSDIKISKDAFFSVDYKNILRSISINDGSEIWSLKTEESLTKSNTKLSIAHDNKNIYFNNSIGDITAVNILSGELLWQLPTQNNNISKNAFQLKGSKLVINDNSILFSNNKNEFYSIDKKIGLINWKNQINSVLKPIVIGKYILTISSSGYLYLADKRSGNILRINDLYTDYKYKKRINVFPTGFIIAMNKIYLSNDDGKLIIVDLDTGIILDKIKIAGNRISQPYVYENDLLLIKNGSIIKYN
jgi:outer membrane protein assembly factor BamB